MTKNESTELVEIDSLLRMRDVEKVTTLKRGFIYRLIQRGEFPGPVKIGIRASAWRSSEVRAWINARPRSQSPMIAPFETKPNKPRATPLLDDMDEYL